MLSNKKVYVGKHSKEIQEKAFALGIKWNDETTEVSHLEYPFLFFHEDNRMTCDKDLVRFNDCYSNYEEITAEEILAMKVPKKTIRDLYPLSGFSVDEGGNIREVSNTSPHYSHELWNVLPSKEEAEAYKILPFLLQWRDRYNEGWKSDWTDEKQSKYSLKACTNKIISQDLALLHSLFTFKSKALRDQFFEDFREELEIVKPLL